VCGNLIERPDPRVPSLDELLDGARELDLNYIPTRYPNWLEAWTPAAAFGASQAATAPDIRPGPLRWPDSSLITLGIPSAAACNPPASPPSTSSSASRPAGATPPASSGTKVLARRTKNNPVLIGEPGVGKTAIAEGLALASAMEA